jgi:hypothetical protein
MLRRLLATTFIMVAVAATATADEKKESKSAIDGSWGREAPSGLKIVMEFNKKKLTVSLEPPGGGEKIIVKSDIKIEDNVVHGTITDVEGGGPQKGDTFSFKVSVKGKTMKVSDLKGNNDPGDEARAAIEGEYKKK